MRSRLALLFQAVLLLAVCPIVLSGQTPSLFEQVQTEVVAANDAELAAVVGGDAEAAASWFLDDATLLPPDGTRVVGRDAIREFWTPTPGTTITRAQTSVETFDFRADLAYLAGSYELEVVTRGESDVSTGRFLMVWRRTPEGWRIAVDMWN